MIRARRLAALAAVLALTAVAPTSAVASDTPVDGVVDCARTTVHAYWNAINGYPQMYTCEI